MTSTWLTGECSFPAPDSSLTAFKGIIKESTRQKLPSPQSTDEANRGTDSSHVICSGTHSQQTVEIGELNPETRGVVKVFLLNTRMPPGAAVPRCVEKLKQLEQPQLPGSKAEIKRLGI